MTGQELFDLSGRVAIVTGGARPEEMPLDKWERVIGVNLTGAFLFARAAGREMLKRNYGRIINVSSVSGLQSSATRRARRDCKAHPLPRVVLTPIAVAPV